MGLTLILCFFPPPHSLSFDICSSGFTLHCHFQSLTFVSLPGNVNKANKHDGSLKGKEAGSMGTHSAQPLRQLPIKTTTEGVKSCLYMEEGYGGVNERAGGG